MGYDWVVVTVCVTGSTDGIGRAAALALLRAGHRVLVHARSPERGRPVVERLVAEVPGGDAALVTGDLSSLAEVRDLAEQVRERAGGGLDALVHDAGVWVRGDVPSVGADGRETTFAVNVLAPHLLTHLLAGDLEAAGGRVVWLGSGMARSGTKHLDPARPGATSSRDEAGAKRAYSVSKAADVALALGWRTRLTAAASTALDPGWVPTKLASAGARGSVEGSAAALAWLAVDATREELAVPYRRGRTPADVPAPLRDAGLQQTLMSACDELAGI